MAKKMTLPKIGVNMTEAVVAKWLVSKGQSIKTGDAVMEAETDKATQDICATESGIVAALLANEGDTVQCGEAILALIEDGEEYVEDADNGGEAAGESAPTAAPSRQEAPERISPPAPAALNASGRVRISPLARAAAKEMGVDYSRVQPAVPGGRIVRRDIVSFAQNANTVGMPPQADKPSSGTPQAAEPPETASAPMSAIRKTIASRMSLSHQEIPSAPLFMTADASAYLDLKAKYKARQLKLSVDAYVMKLAAMSIGMHPEINTAWENNTIVRKDGIHIGVAVDTDRGLMVPVVKNANEKNMADISAEIYALAEAAKLGKAPRASLSGSTFTITNLGAFGVEQFVPIINPPECCILAVGAIRKTFVPDENDAPVARSVMTLCLVHDHRIIDGAPAARFLRELKRFIENPVMCL